MLTLIDYGRRFGLREDLDREALEAAVGARLRAVYPGEPILRCGACNFCCPDTVLIAACPKCGHNFYGRSEETRAVQATETRTPPKVVSMDDKRKDKDPVAELDRLESEITEALVGGEKLRLQAQLKVSRDLHQISSRDLWRGRGEYKSFVQYAKERFEIRKDSARFYVAIGESFPTDESAAGLSFTHLWNLARVPNAKEREKLAKQVRDGKLEKTRDLAAAVKAKRVEAGLVTLRTGHATEGFVKITAKLKPGVIAEGEWQTARGGGSQLFDFQIGDYAFRVRRPKDGKTYEVRLLEPKSEEPAK